MISYGVQTEKGAGYYDALKGHLPGNLTNVIQIGFVASIDEANAVSNEIARGGVATTFISSEAADACGKPGMIIVVESELVQARV